MEDKTNRPFVIHPWKTMMAVFLVAVMVLFFALTILFMSSGTLGEKTQFHFPIWAWMGIVIIGVSSFTLETARSSLQKQDFDGTIFRLRLTLLFGLVFIGTQFAFLSSLFNQEVFFVQKSLEAYLYILTGLHAIHVVAGALVLFFATRSVKKRPTNRKTPILFSVSAFFWHFLSGLWVYLVAVMFFNIAG